MFREGAVGQASCVPRSCREILQRSAGQPSGFYMIDADGPGGADAVEVWCEMELDGGGWTIKILADPYTTTPTPAEYLRTCVFPEL